MSKTIAQMRAEGKVRRPKDAIEMCLAQDLVSEVSRLTAEKTDLMIEAGRSPDSEGDEPRSPRKMSEGAMPPRVAEVDGRLAEVYDEMREHTGTLTLEGEDEGDWRRWADANPVRFTEREDGDPIMNVLDRTVGMGWCNASALIARLGDFAHSWNGEAITAEDWQHIRANASPGDLKAAARTIVMMHEDGGYSAPKSPRPSSSTVEAGSA